MGAKKISAIFWKHPQERAAKQKITLIVKTDGFEQIYTVFLITGRSFTPKEAIKYDHVPRQDIPHSFLVLRWLSDFL